MRENKLKLMKIILTMQTDFAGVPLEGSALQ